MSEYERLKPKVNAYVKRLLAVGLVASRKERVFIDGDWPDLAGEQASSDGQDRWGMMQGGERR